MADAQSDADKIRNKRLAKLGGGSSSGERPATPNTPPSPSTPASSSATEPPKMGQAEQKTSPPQQSTSNPFSQLGMKSEPQNASGIRIHSDPARSITPIDGQSEPASRSRSRQGGQVSIETWEDRTLSGIFRITLNPDQKTDLHGNKLNYVADVRKDLEEEEASLRITLATLDQALPEAGKDSPEGKPLAYLLGCWKRVLRQLRSMRGTSAEDPKMRILQEAKRICMSYCIFAVTFPEMFEQEPYARNPLADALLIDPEGDGGLCHDFFVEAIARFPEDDSIKEALVGAIETLSKDLSKKSMNDSFKPYMQALRNYARYPGLVNALTESPSFIPEDITAEKIEEETLLGPFFSLSPLQGEVAMNYFMGARARDEAFIRNSQNALQMTLRAHQEELFDITNCIIKSSKEPREKMLDWFALVVNKNHKRRAFRVDERTVSSDGFMINVTAILDRLCEPFMDTTFSKVDRIDVNYLRRSPRVIIQDETKINADQKTSDEFYAQPASGTNNFISEIFFLTVAAHHYGTEASNNKLDDIKRELKQLEKRLGEFEAERAKFAHNPAQLKLFEEAFKKYKERLEKGQCIVHAITGVLLDDLAQQRSMQLMRYVIVWLIRLVAPGSQYPKKQISLSLPEQQPDVFRCLPEYFIEDIVDNFKFVTGHIPWIIMSTQCEELLTMCVTFLRCSEYIKNPGLKSGLVQILYYGVLPFGRKPKGILGDLLNSSQFALKHLLHALMKFYIEAETTGTHTQFYDKFNIRYEIFQVIRCFWTNPIYRNNLQIESQVNPAFFVKFVNLTLNDVTFLLDESFGAFKQIHALQDELEGSEAAAMDEQQKQQKQELLDDNQRKAKSWMQLTNETISMIKLFTEALADAFTSQEIVQRLADMLDYNLDSMVGPKQRDLKVRDAQQYGFKPLELLSDLISVYLNLKDKTNFQLAVARDGRSYKYETFRHASEIMQRSSTSLKSPSELKAFLKFADDVQATKEAEAQEEEWLGEIPDEFLDPILATLMEDPVILPISRNIVDRSMIRSHLLSDPHDPFNRTPLKIEDVIPDEDLKARIDKFRADARERAKKAIEEQRLAEVRQQTPPTIAEGGRQASLVEANMAQEKMDESEG